MTSELKALIAPRIVTKKRPMYRLSDGWSLDPFPARIAEKATKQVATAGMLYAGDGDDVTVLREAKVGGYDTAALRASDAKALLGWLRRRGFASDARLEEWLRPYTRKGWAITAFRFRPSGRSYTSEPVCLSFRSDRPVAHLAEGLDLPGSAFRGRWLTSFLDRRAVRPEGELYFDASPDQAKVEPPPVVR